MNMRWPSERNCTSGAHSHTTARPTRGHMFLAWPRVFLSEFEKRLRRQKPDVTIPTGTPEASVPGELKKISTTRGNASPVGVALPNLQSLIFSSSRACSKEAITRRSRRLGGTVSHSHSAARRGFLAAPRDGRPPVGPLVRNRTARAPNMTRPSGRRDRQGKKVQTCATPRRWGTCTTTASTTTSRAKDESFRATLERNDPVRELKLDCTRNVSCRSFGFYGDDSRAAFPEPQAQCEVGLFPTETSMSTWRPAK